MAYIRGEVCIYSASFLSFTAMILLLFVYIGQLNASDVPRSISMANVVVSGYRNALKAAFGGVDPIDGLYTDNASAPLGVSAGLRQEYKFGLYSHCAYVDGNQGTCGNRVTASKFQPYSAITSDMSLNYTQFSNAVIPMSTFRDDVYLGSFSRSAYYTMLIGFIFTVLTFIFGLFRHTCTFSLSVNFALVASVFLLLGAFIWTAVIHKAESINSLLVDLAPSATSVPVGIVVSAGPGLYMAWTAVACMLTSLIPYMLSCCTYRGL